MASNAKMKEPDDAPMSVSGLAEACGTSRQRIYTLIRKGIIDARHLAGGYVIFPKEVQRILANKTQVKIKGGARQVRFDLERI